MIIHCTRKLATRLPEVSETPLEETSPLGSWHAHHYTIDRRNCVMFCHDRTRFTLFMAGLRKPDYANLEHWFIDVMANVMLRLGYGAALLEKAVGLVDGLAYDIATDRSVLSTLNVARSYDLEGQLWQVANVMDLPPLSTSVQLNERPVRIKGMRASECLFPDREMRAFLENIPTWPQSPTATVH